MFVQRAQIIHRVIGSAPEKMSVYRCPMKNIIGRLRDWRHERHISHLTKRCLACIYAGDRVMARLWDALRLEAIRRRSPEQVARMERARGLGA